jgi:hypothetical protein
VRNNYPKIEENFTVIAYPTNEIFTESSVEAQHMEELSVRTKRIFPLSKNLIIGSVLGRLKCDEGDCHRREYIVFEPETGGTLSFTISEMKCRVVDSQATGETNLAITSYAFTGHRIYERDIPQDTKLQEFLNPTIKLQIPPAPKKYQAKEGDGAALVGDGIAKIVELPLREEVPSSDDEFSFSGTTDPPKPLIAVDSEDKHSAYNQVDFRDTNYLLK